MAKISLEFDKFKLVIEAERDELPNITSHVNRQLAGMVEPAAALAAGQPAKYVESTVRTPPPGQQAPEDNGNGNNKTSPRNRGKGTGAARGKSAPVTFNHDSEKWGFPPQDFNTAEKAMYVLYVVEHETGQTELSAGIIAATFNQHYKRAGTVRPSNVSKYLGTARTERPVLVEENTTKTPVTWFLTTEGRKPAEALVAQAKGLMQAAQAAPPAAAGVQDNGAR